VFRTIAKVAGVKPPRFRVPHAAAWLMGKWGDFQESRGKDAIANSTTIRYAFTTKFRFASTKAATELGYTFGPLEPAISDALAWWRANGML
jgi:dihydroflavonol-4-reductase